MTEIDPAQAYILQPFSPSALPEMLRPVARPYAEIAASIVATMPRSLARTTAIRKLLEARDAALRAFSISPQPQFNNGDESMANQSGIAITIRAFLPTGKTLDEQFVALSLVKDAHASGDYAAVLKAASIEEVKAEQKTRRVEEKPATNEAPGLLSAPSTTSPAQASGDQPPANNEHLAPGATPFPDGSSEAGALMETATEEASAEVATGQDEPAAPETRQSGRRRNAA